MARYPVHDTVFGNDAVKPMTQEGLDQGHLTSLPTNPPMQPAPLPANSAAPPVATIGKRRAHDTVFGDVMPRTAIDADAGTSEGAKKAAATRAAGSRSQDPGAWHQRRIARQTLNMPDPIAGVMGGPTKAQARQILRRKG
jgi:hypothetical protein